jgi:hypothetical protein
MLIVVELLRTLAALAFLVLFIKFVNVALRRYLIVGLCVNLVLNAVPDCINALFIIQTFKNAVAADQKKVKIVLQLKNFDFWLTHDDICVATIFCSLGLNITKGA